jgi:hypothetical protein
MTAQPSNFVLDVTEYVEGTERLNREDLQIPHLILVQAQHQDIPENNKHLGEWYNDLTGEFSKDITAVVLSLVKGRVAFPRKFSRESKALCASDDALSPRQDYIGHEIFDEDRGIKWIIDGSACAQCPFSEFGPNGETPLCAKAFSYAMIDVEVGVPFIVRAQRTGIQAAKQLNTLAKLLGRRKLIHITSREVKSDSGTYYVPVFATSEPATQELKDFAMQTSLTWGNIAARVDVSQNESAQHTNGNSAPSDPTEDSNAPDIPF